jgi:hypothetical protein
MSAASPIWNPPTFEVLPNAISSRDSESGAMRYDSLAGPMTDLFGREVAPVPASPVRAKAQGLMTLATSGRLGNDSSPSAELQRSLESSLMKQLDSAGSTLFKLTWRGKRTPLGRRYLEQQALARRTPVYGCTSVPTPAAQEPGGTQEMFLARRRKAAAKGIQIGKTSQGHMSHVAQLASVHTPNLDDCNNTTRASGQFGSLTRDVNLASVPTPMAGTPAQKGYNAAGNNDYSRKIVELATVCSPTAQDCSRGGLPARPWDRGVPLTQQVALATVETPRAEERQQQNSRDAGMALSNTANLSSVASPSARDWKDSPGMSDRGVDPDGSIRTRLDQLPRQAQLADSGETATGGTAKTGSTGQLNPEYSRWLMGLPIEFSNCVDMGMQSWRSKPQRS